MLVHNGDRIITSQHILADLDAVKVETDQPRALVGRLTEALGKTGPRWRDDFFRWPCCTSCGVRSDLVNGTKHEASCPYAVLDDPDAAGALAELLALRRAHGATVQFVTEVKASLAALGMSLEVRRYPFDEKGTHVVPASMSIPGWMLVALAQAVGMFDVPEPATTEEGPTA